jgi:hypothetical protein
VRAAPMEVTVLTPSLLRQMLYALSPVPLLSVAAFQDRSTSPHVEGVAVRPYGEVGAADVCAEPSALLNNVKAAKTNTLPKVNEAFTFLWPTLLIS